MKEYDGDAYREFRCTECRALLAEEYIFAGRLRIKCRKCGEMNTINFRSTKQEILKRFGITPSVFKKVDKSS